MPETLTVGQKVPARSERDTVGGTKSRIRRGTPEFASLVAYTKPDVVFKDEEGSGADRMMSPRLRDRLEILAGLVAKEFPGVKVRVTEAWDENGEHTAGSLHYEGRAADLTTSDRDAGKLGRVARLAVDAGFDWVFFEDAGHVHVSVKRDAAAPDPVPAHSAAPAGGSRVQAALAALAPGVRSSSPDALPFAFRAYFAFRAAHPDEVRNPLLYFVDYGLDNRTRRGFVFDMDAPRVVEGPFAVAHGRGSLAPRDGVPIHFGNVGESAKTSLGLYLTKNTYDFEGHAGGKKYTSIGLRLSGRSGRFNDHAFERGVVAHGAPYVTADDAGRSEGCPAMEQDRAHRLLPRLAEGGVVFLFSPNDAEWVAHDPWVHAG